MVNKLPDSSKTLPAKIRRYPINIFFSPVKKLTPQHDITDPTTLIIAAIIEKKGWRSDIEVLMTIAFLILAIFQSSLPLHYSH